MTPTPLEIKTKALGRLIKEESLYQQDVVSQNKHIAALQAQKADEYDIKKQIEVLEDTKQMIPELRSKIRDASRVLELFLAEYTGSEEQALARENIEHAKKLE